MASSWPHATADGLMLTHNRLASPSERQAVAGPCSAEPHGLWQQPGSVTWSVPTTRPTRPTRGGRAPGRIGTISRSCSRSKVIPAADPWKSDPATADPPRVTTMVFGSGCSTTIDPPPVWASLVLVGVTSAWREGRTVWEAGPGRAAYAPARA